MTAIKAIQKQIVAIGGALAASIPESRLVLSYVLSLADRSQSPTVLMIDTANGNSPLQTSATYRALAGTGNFTPNELNFFGRMPVDADLRKLVLSQDVILVSGGNTKTMLAAWHDYGLPELLREAWENGTILAGSSAGAICWFEQCLTDSRAGDFLPMDCLGFLPGSCCPHFDGEKGRKETYFRLVSEGTLKPGIAIDERVAVHYIGDRIERVVTPNEQKGAYLVHAGAGRIIKSRLKKTLAK